MFLRLEGGEKFKNASVSVGPRAVKYNIVSKDLGLRQKCDFSVQDWKYPIWANLVGKNQNFQFKLEFGSETNSNM